MFDDASIKEYYSVLRKKVLTVLDSIILGEDRESELEEIDKEMITFSSPNTFVGKESVEIKMEKQFHSSCLTISQLFGLDAIKMTTIQFYAALERVKEQQKKKQNAKI